MWESSICPSAMWSARIASDWMWPDATALSASSASETAWLAILSPVTAPSARSAVQTPPSWMWPLWITPVAMPQYPMATTCLRPASPRRRTCP